MVIPVLCIAIIGLLSSFKFYISHGRTAFFKDYLALSWVTGWRVSLMVFSVFLMMFFLGFSHNLAAFTPKTEPYWTILILGYETLFYLLLYRSFKRIAQGKHYKMN
ncbi:MAG: hypothetical protein L7T62_00300 [Flavobacteriaceae bacterium]|nr:hypothetical protein [Flavobacteriaceae bacterium]